MKRMIICLFIVFGLTMLSLGSYMTINSVSDEISEKIVKIEEYYNAEDYENAKKTASETEAIWEDFYKKRYLIADEAHIMEISSILSRITTLIEVQSDDTTVECKSAIVIIGMFKKKQEISLYNIL